MTRVELAIRWLYLDLLIEQIQRGPKFTRLPPAHYWHGHKNERRPMPRPGSTIISQSPVRFTVSRKKWTLDQPHEPIIQPVPLRMPAKAYVYCDMGAPLKRTALALKILEDIEAKGGDICTKECRDHRGCRCMLPEGHEGTSLGNRHKCVHVLYPDLYTRSDEGGESDDLPV